MYRKIAVVGVTVAAIVGAGTAALATSGSDSTTGSGNTGTAAAAAKQHPRRAAIAGLRRAVHGEVTTLGKAGYITHSAIRGSVDAVSATSITVKAADGFTQTYTLTKATKVMERVAGKAKATAATLADLKVGDKVGAIGKAAEKSTDNPTATIVVDGLKK